MEKKCILLGSTGSIGQSTLRVIRSYPDEYRLTGIACWDRLVELRSQIREFHPESVGVSSETAVLSDDFKKLKSEFSDIEFFEGEKGVIELAGRQSDITVVAIVGSAGLRPSLAAIKSAKRLAIANKETLVMAGSHVMNLACENGTDIIPVDSEHSAVFSLLSHLGLGELERIILTASGGALRNMPVDRLSSVSPEMALAHPTWSMGSKITIDSATLMNKGLEVIEAHHLFNLPYDKIDVIIHPESVVHSMVETIDGVSYAHMGVTDMAVPIAAAFSHPVKRKNPFGRLNLTETGSLTFSAVDRSRYPSLDICYGAGRAGGVMPAVLNAANEIAVGQFLDGKILFTEIVRVVEKTMALFNHHGSFSMDDIFSVDAEARIIAKEITGVK